MINNGLDGSENVRKRRKMKKKKTEGLEHPVFPGGHPSKY